MNPIDAQYQALALSFSYLPRDGQDKIHRAFLLAKEAHAPQIRSSGEPYISHPLTVAQILADMKMDADTLCAALLHDVLEDTPIQKQCLQKAFGSEVAELVDGVSKLTQMEFATKAEAQAENFRKMLLAMTRDIRVILVKLADRWHNMQTLHSLAAAKQARIATETLEIYAPIANRLGMHHVRINLEELAFAAIYPLRYRVLHEAVFEARDMRLVILQHIEQAIGKQLEHYGIPASSVIGRQKHLYSIYQKMRRKHLSFSEIMDIYGFRIVVKDIDTCYRALGAVHNLFKPVPGKFKDYIAIPKANSYQSLHTILFGPQGVPIEIQIRSAEMNNYAEYGIAAHWLYKENEERVNITQLKVSQWLRTVIEMQQASGNSQEFIESVKIDLFPDEVYVFTPKGRILELPGGATPIDFAYSVHTDVGDHCLNVRINRRPAALSARLINGQTVEILTSMDATPKPEWLNFVVTGRARSRIRQYLKENHQDASIALGKQLLLNALITLGENNPNLNDHQQRKLLKLYPLSSFDALLANIGLGHLAPMEVAQRLLGQSSLYSPSLIPLTIKGTEGMLMKFSLCCHPIPPDNIIGLLIPGEGLRIHRETCSEITSLARPPVQKLALTWQDQLEDQFKALIQVDVENKQGVLARLTNAISATATNIIDIKVIVDDGVFSTVQLLILVKNTPQLTRIIERLTMIPAVLKAIRG